MSWPECPECPECPVSGMSGMSGLGLDSDAHGTVRSVSGTVRSVSDLCPTDVRLCVRSCPKTMSGQCPECPAMSDKLSGMSDHGSGFMGPNRTSHLPVSGSGSGFMGPNRTCFGAKTAMSGLGPRPRARTGHRNVRFEPSQLHCPVWAPDSWARTGRARTGHCDVRFEP